MKKILLLTVLTLLASCSPDLPSVPVTSDKEPTDSTSLDEWQPGLDLDFEINGSPV